MTHTVMLVDDHQMVRVGFRLLLESRREFEVIAEADSAESAYRTYRTVRPDLVVMDVTMAGSSGLEATHRILAFDPQARILGLSMHDDPSVARKMLQAGALGFLSKRSAPELLSVALASIAERRTYIDPAVAQGLALQQLGGPSGPIDLLSEREFEVFLHLARGLSVNRIADMLSLSPRTVGTHLYRIKQKLGVENQTELALIAVRHGLIESP